MIIPLSSKKLEVGDTVVAKRDIMHKWYIIKAGHEFKIIDKDSYGFIILDDSGIKINHISNYDITLKLDFKAAEKEYIFTIETAEYKKYLCGKCPNRESGYNDREEYDACKIIKSYYPLCCPTLDCAKYLTQEQINKNKILLKYLRQKKLEDVI